MDWTVKLVLLDPLGDGSGGWSVRINNSDINYISSDDEQTWRPRAKHDPTHFWWETWVKYLSCLQDRSIMTSCWKYFLFIIYITFILSLDFSSILHSSINNNRGQKSDSIHIPMLCLARPNRDIIIFVHRFHSEHV